MGVSQIWYDFCKLEIKVYNHLITLTLILRRSFFTSFINSLTILVYITSIISSFSYVYLLSYVVYMCLYSF